MKPMACILFISIFLGSLYAQAAGDVACRTFKDDLAAINIDDQDEYSPENARALQTLLESQISAISLSLGGVDEVSDADDKLDFLEFAARVQDLDFSDEVTSQRQYFVALRALYTVCAMDFIGIKMKFFQKIGKGFRILGGSRSFDFDPDYSSEVDEDDEANFLYDTLSGVPVPPENMVGMSIEQVSELDVNEFHTVWHPQSYVDELRQNKIDAFNKLEATATVSVTKHLQKKGRLALDQSSYDLDKARRVLEFDSFKNTATSPKIKTRDNFGLKWKLKWGNETQVEPIVNRLWMYLGGKFADMTYSNEPGVEGVVLILGDYRESKGCEKVSSAYIFIKCLRKSKYLFDLKPFLLDDGLITESNVDQILKNLDERGLKTRQDFIGREYLVFNTSMLEFSAKGFTKRGGPAGFSSAGAKNDRVARGLGIYNAWINNIDAKDENNKAYLITTYNEAGEKKVEFIEAQHDMGNALGEFDFIEYPVPGYINGFEIRNLMEYNPCGTPSHRTKDCRNSGVMPKQGKMVIHTRELYRPKAWGKSTTADALWMAKKLAKLPVSEIQKSVAASKWPQFIQDLYTYKLIARRNQIAEAFAITDMLVDGNNAKDYLPPVLRLKLTTHQDRLKACEVTGLKYEVLIEELVSLGLLPENNTKAKLKKDYEEKIINKRGKVASYKDSLIIGLLEKHQYPSGLSRRVGRYEDHEPLKFVVPREYGLKIPVDPNSGR